MEGVVEHLVDVQVDGPAQGLVQSLEEGAAADLLGVAGVEIVDEAVEDLRVGQGLLHVDAAFLPFHHDQEFGVGHRGDEAPIVGVAGDDEEGVHVVSVVLLAGAGGEGDVHQGFVLLHPLDHDVLHGQVGVVLQHFPG